MPALRNRYFNCLTTDGRPVAWHPPHAPDGVLPDSVYFGGVLAAADARVERSGLTFYATQDLDELPSYGRDVVALVTGDEFARVPAYATRVRAVFKNHAVTPSLPDQALRRPLRLAAGTLAWYLRTVLLHAPGRARYRRARRSGVTPAPIWRLPIGVLDQLPLPLTPLRARATDVFFGGSVGHGAGLTDRISPKVLARRHMLEHAGRLAARHPGLRVVLATTRTFEESMAADAATYSRQLMDARVALVPRGADVETFRFWQALRFGCVPVVDALPRHPWFYDGAPAVRLRSWDALEDVVVPLLSDASRLERLHQDSLAWWSTRAAEDALGQYVAARLNSIADD